MKRSLGSYLLIFLFGVVVFGALQYTPFFPDPDSFYHAKIALLLQERGIFHEFPWLQGTVLKDAYVDHHFFYHVLLIPFVTVFDPLVGLKVATVLFGAGALTMLYAVVRALRASQPWLWTLLAFTSTGFLYRLNLAKAPGISVFFLLIGIWFLIKYTEHTPRLPTWRYGAGFFILNFIYVWLYAAWPFLLVFTIIWWLAFLILERRNFYHMLACGVGGIFAGLIFNPFFPENIQFLWLLFVKIGLINYHNILSVGNEWRNLPFLEFVGSSFLVFMATILDITLAFLVIKRVYQNRSNKILLNSERSRITLWAALLVMTLLVFAGTLKARRNIEYLVPFEVITAALGITLWVQFLGLSLRRSVNDVLRLKRLKFSIVIAPFWIALVLVSAALVQHITPMAQGLHSGFSIKWYEPTAKWLSKHTPIKSIVLLSDWDLFPMYFYLNDHNYYLEGLDPTLTYLKDPELDRSVVKVWNGQAGEDTYNLIKNTFQAAYIVVPLGSVLERILAKDSRFKIVYEYKGEKIYQTL